MNWQFNLKFTSKKSRKKVGSVYLETGQKKKASVFSVQQNNKPDAFLKKLINSTSNIGLFDISRFFFRREAIKKDEAQNEYFQPRNGILINKILLLNT